jgi:hypothetical protein
MKEAAPSGNSLFLFEYQLFLLFPHCPVEESFNVLADLFLLILFSYLLQSSEKAHGLVKIIFIVCAELRFE